jgi:hypothetical protein
MTKAEVERRNTSHGCGRVLSGELLVAAQLIVTFD